MTEGNWDVSDVDAEFVDVPLGGVWTAPDGGRYRCVGGGCGRCAFLRPPIRVGKTGVETTCANQLDADLNSGPRLACFPFERRDGVGVRFERVKETVPTMSDAPKPKRKSRVGGRLQDVAAWFAERWEDDPGGVAGAIVAAFAALSWGALVVAALFG